MSDAYIESEPSRRAVTDYLDKYTRQSAEVAQNSFAVFRRAIHPGIKWGDFVARLTRELQQFGEALEAGGRPKLALCTAPQHGKSLAAEDFAAWISGRNPNFKTIYASYSEDLGTRMSLNLQRLFRSRRYHDIFPHIEIDEPGWVANTNLTEFAYFRGSFRSTTINGPITGWGWTWHSRVDHALHIVPICLDQLAVEPLAHEWRQRTIVALRLEGVVPATMVMEAAEELGFLRKDPETKEFHATGEGGVKGYLRWIGINRPDRFVALMAHVAPKQVFADVTHHDNSMTDAEIEAELRERGLPVDLLLQTILTNTPDKVRRLRRTHSLSSVGRFILELNGGIS
jgi:hypothetical protein